MSKNSSEKRRILGNRMKQSRRLPILTALRTHRKIQTNKFSRSWRSQKMRIKVD